MYQYTFCIWRARHTVPAIGPFWAQLARSAQSAGCAGRCKALLRRAHTCPTDARTPQPTCVPSSPALCAGRRARAHPTPSASAPTFPTTWTPPPPPSRGRRVGGGWPGRPKRACGKHTETSQRTEQIRLAQAKTKIKLRIWGQNAPFLSSISSIESMEGATPRVVRCHRL